MRNVRAALAPVALLVAMVALAWLDVQVTVVARFDFIWDVLLGAALGVGLALLPGMAGFALRKNALTSMFWVCGFLALLLIFYQYMTLVTGMHIEALKFLSEPRARLRIVEGAVLGYCSFVAGRGKT